MTADGGFGANSGVQVAVAAAVPPAAVGGEILWVEGLIVVVVFKGFLEVHLLFMGGPRREMGSKGGWCAGSYGWSGSLLG